MTDQLEAFTLTEAYNGDPLNPDLGEPTPREIIASLTQEQREQRVRALVKQAHWIYDEGIRVHGRGRNIAGTVIMWSGGNDSNTLAHVMRSKATHAAMIDTTIGVEQTRQFVRKQAAEWGLPLIEHTGPASYEELVLEKLADYPNGRGFPGPGMHYLMYQRLKERGFRKIPHDFDISGSTKDAVVLLGGRRRAESERRKDVPEFEDRGTMLWITPLVMWTKLDIITYRRMNPDVPRNQVADLIHMSGECLCGSFAKPDELEEVGYWYPETKQMIRDLEAKADAQGIPAPFNRWGHGSNGNAKGAPTGRSLTCGAACEPLKGQSTIEDVLA
jgi:3'-phosphoadenosine 5'-phosphosulfate sulfotransferase (PAPS reductase)/FAD synthetase